MRKRKKAYKEGRKIDLSKVAQNGMKVSNDPPKGAAKTKPTEKPHSSAEIMGLTGQRVYTEAVSKRHQDFSDPSKFSEQYHHKGDMVGPALNTHTTSGVRRQGKQVTRKEDPTDRGTKGSVRGKSTKEFSKGGKVARKALSAATKKTLQAKAKKSGISYGKLAKVYRRGQGAWMSGGSRKGASMAAWAMGRVNSFIRGSRKHDTDLR